MRKIIALFLAVLLVFAGCSTTEETPPSTDSTGLEQYETYLFDLFDTITVIMGYAESQEEFDRIMEQVEKELETYHQLYDIYNTYDGINNLKTINDAAGTQPVVVDEKIIDLLEFSQDMYTRSGGLTNVAMGSVLRIWHEYRTVGRETPDKAAVPPQDMLEDAAKHVNIQDMVVDRQASTVFLRDPEMSLDVGSVAKGYAVEKVAESLEAAGHLPFLINVGGNIRAVGAKPNGSPWYAGVENPYGESDFMGVVEMDDEALVTSGNYQRYYEVDGQRYHHIIHPRTLQPENYTTAVAIFCPDSGMADALTTALYNMPMEEGLRWVEDQKDMEAMWMLPDKTVVYSSGFKDHLRPEEG